MARIKIKDLPKDKKISKAEMKKVMGGAIFNPQPEPPGHGNPYAYGVNLTGNPLNQGSLFFGVRY
jgi:hypothetical protein